MNDDQYLNVADHNRDVSGLTYIYPVVSRRAVGVSIGINLNINNACNWRCLYCQVPNLKRGSPPAINLEILEDELRRFLDYILNGDFMQRYVAEGDRKLQDIAFSGNGEPTSAKEFPAAIPVIFAFTFAEAYKIADEDAVATAMPGFMPVIGAADSTHEGA